MKDKMGIFSIGFICALAGCTFFQEARDETVQRGKDGCWTFENRALRVEVNGADTAWTVTDKRCGRVWRQAKTFSVVRAIRPLPARQAGIEAELVYSKGEGSSVPLTVRVRLEEETSDMVCEITGNLTQKIDRLDFPAPFVLDAPEGVLVIPQNAGLLFRVDELDWNGKSLGGFMSMPWFGETDLATGQGYGVIFETPDDVSYQGKKVKGDSRDVLSAQPSFQPQKGMLGYTRKLIYHFADKGGYVALAKRYRAFAKGRGLLKTLAEKRRERPSIDKLVGAVNIYCGSFKNVETLRELGIGRAMISGFSGDHVRQINAMGYLTSHYDIYTDLYEPGTPPANWERCQGFSFPADVIKKKDGSNQIGWCPVTDSKTGKVAPSYVICWTCGLRTLEEKMPKRLAESPFTAYFLDCVTASALYECFDPAHPLTRAQDRETRAKQLGYLSGKLGLVVGSEQGRDWAVPVADYFEGVMSTAAFFANPKEIHKMPFETLTPSPAFARYEEFGINPGRRVPLFQLVYGDCCETTWRWGDNSHRMPYLWWKKDLLAMLHAAMPTWVLWKEQQGLFKSEAARFKECYDSVCRWRRVVGYSEMLNHERLASDGLVQRSVFANGASVTVNFADAPRQLSDGTQLPPHAYLLKGNAVKQAGLPIDVPVCVR